MLLNQKATVERHASGVGTRLLRLCGGRGDRGRLTCLGRVPWECPRREDHDHLGGLLQVLDELGNAPYGPGDSSVRLADNPNRRGVHGPGSLQLVEASQDIELEALEGHADEVPDGVRHGRARSGPCEPAARSSRPAPWRPQGCGAAPGARLLEAPSAAWRRILREPLPRPFRLEAPRDRASSRTGPRRPVSASRYRPSHGGCVLPTFSRHPSGALTTGFERT